MSRFISEDDLKNFEGWLAYQGYDPEMLDLDDLAKWRELFEQISKRPDAKVGLMKLGSKAPDDRIYGVAVQDEGLWLTLWVRRSWKGEFFVFMPRADGSDAHASYHRDGRFHHQGTGRVRSRSPRAGPSPWPTREVLLIQEAHPELTNGSNCFRTMSAPCGKVLRTPERLVQLLKLFLSKRAALALVARETFIPQ